MRALESTVVFEHLLEAHQGGLRYVVEQGGARSGKTYNILLWILLYYIMKNRGTGKVIGVCRKTRASLKKSVLRDWEEILDKLGWRYSVNQQELSYSIRGCTVDFFGLDKDSKAKGIKRHFTYINESNDLDYMDYHQLNIRTEEMVVMDYNPDEDFWVFDKVLPREDAIHHITTYEDNPFLPQSLVKEIERLKRVDEELWQVYGQGKLGKSRSMVYQYHQCRDIPEGAKFLGYGLDWGYTNDYTAVVAMWLHGGNVYADEVIYELELGNRDIAKLLKQADYQMDEPVYCDSAEPKSIAELEGYNIMAIPVKKAAGSIKSGISILRQYPLYVTSRSANIIKELKKYKYIKDRNGELTNTPIDAFNHACDAMRYVALEVLSQGSYTEYAVA